METREANGNLKVFQADLTDPNRWISHELVAQALHTIASVCRVENDKWYHDTKGNPIEPLTGDRYSLIHSEISEAFEAYRKNLKSDHIPEFLGEEEELADAIIRIMDYAANKKLRLGEAFVAKLLFNRVRKDHTNEARESENGKRF